MNGHADVHLPTDGKHFLPHPSAAALCAVAIVCFALAAASIGFTKEAGRVAAIWPMNALVLAVVLRHARGAWPWILVACAAGNLAAALWTGDTLPLAFALVGANLAEIGLCAAILHGTHRPVDITRPDQLFRFIAVAGVVAPALSAVIAAGALAGLTTAVFQDTFVVWFTADALGMVVFGPAALAMHRDAAKELLAPHKFRSDVALLVGLLAVLILTFSQANYPLLFVPGPLLILIAFRAGLAGVALGLMLTAAVAITCAIAGQGPTQLINDTTTVQVMALQVFLAFLSLTTLPVASALAERDRLRRRLQSAQASLIAAREKAEQSEARFRQMADVSSDMMARMDMNGVIRFVSPSAKTIMGYDAESLVGKTTMSMTHPDDVPIVMAQFKQLIANGPNARPRTYEFRARHRDGHWLWLEGIPHILFNADGKPIGIQDSVRDISARKQLEQELVAAVARAKAGERRLEMAMDIADIVVWQRDKATGALKVNGPDERILDRALPTVTSVGGLMDLVYEDDRAEVAQRWAEHLNGGPRLVAEHRSQSGKRWLLTVVEMTRDQAGNHDGAVGLMMNITDRKNVELRLKEAHDKAEKATRVKADFLANMSHEIRTPLNSIIGFGGLLAASRNLDTRERHYIDIIGGASRSLLAIVNDVLDFSSLESGSIKLNERPFAVRKLVGEAAESFVPAATEKGLAIDVCVAGAPTPAHMGDEPRLRQVLINLIGNAIKFTVNGGVTVTLTAAAPCGDRQRLRIEVRDTGIGIAAEKQSALFSRFTQADSSINRRFGGSGLGLAISKHLVELMGGQIGVDSVEGVGTAFWAVLDLKCAAESDLIVESDASTLAEGLSPCRLLVVDDVDLNRQLIAALLTPHGFVIDEAENGGDAIRAVEAKVYDLVLMDVQMPGIDGLTATRTIRAMQQAKHVPVVAMTAQALPEQIDACREAGMDDYIAKPVQPSALFAALRKWARSTGEQTSTAAAPAPIDAVVDRLRGKFVERCRDELREVHRLMEAHSADAREGLHKIIHRLAGTAGTLGFADLGVLASDIDQTFARGEAPDEASLEQLVASLEALVEAA